jgi:glycerophosphoryl diester phosphodiesterase
MKPSFLCHRGAGIDRPENTLPAFQRAVELGAEGFEFDVRMSRDGQLFILHDQTLDRTTSGSGRASDLSFDELRQLDAGGWFDSQYAGTPIGSPADALSWARGKAIILLDLKQSGPDFDRKVASEIQAHGNPAEIIIGVRSPEQACTFRELIPQCRQLAFMKTPDLISEFAAAGTEILRLWLHWITADPNLVKLARETGKQLLTNATHGTPEEARILVDIAPDWILIDDFAQLKRSLQELTV